MTVGFDIITLTAIMTEEGRVANWTRGEVTEASVLAVIGEYGAASMNEIKGELGTSSEAIRKPLGLLYSKNQIIATAYGKAIVWMVRDGVKGYPSPAAKRRAVGKPARLGQHKKKGQAQVDKSEPDTTYEEYLAAIAAHRKESGFNSFEEELQFNRDDPDTHSVESEVWIRQDWGVGEFYRDPPDAVKAKKKVGREAPEETEPQDLEM
jgi:hypothetical protein